MSVSESLVPDDAVTPCAYAVLVNVAGVAGTVKGPITQYLTGSALAEAAGTADVAATYVGSVGGYAGLA